MLIVQYTIIWYNTVITQYVYSDRIELSKIERPLKVKLLEDG